ncbi:MGMT family protein, partial [Aeromonas veronii]|uniref:methylated-DNA--[protein]-cysteine S-methyltransferase n=1 Tax=Aeromonas veronii TaxID=654 RepID=UPI0030070D3C
HVEPPAFKIRENSTYEHLSFSGGLPAQVANAVGNPKAARAVGLAVGANPVALMIPCHRVIQQNGKLGGYHWGETRKQAIHAWEAARYE